MFSEESQTAEEESVTEEEDDEGDVEDREKNSSVSWFLCSYVQMERKSIYFDIQFFYYTYSKQKTKSLKLAKELSDIVIYCKSVHFRGFEDSWDKQSFYEMASFKEGKAVELVEESGVMSLLLPLRHNTGY